MALAGEDAGEELVVLEPQRLHPGDEGLERERDDIAEHEHGGRGHGAGGAAPERRGGPEDDRAERRVHQPERGEPRERDHVRAEPNDGVDDLDRRPGDGGGAAAGAQRKAGRQQGEPDDPITPPATVRPAAAEVDAAARAISPTKSGEAGDAGLVEEGDRGPALAPAVGDPEHVAHEEEHRSDRDREEQQRLGPFDRVEPQRRQHLRGAEQLAVEDAEARGGEARGERDRPQMPVAGEPAVRLPRSQSASSASTRPCPASPNIIPNMRTNETAVKSVGSTSR